MGWEEVVVSVVDFADCVDWRVVEGSGAGKVGDGKSIAAGAKGFEVL